MPVLPKAQVLSRSVSLIGLRVHSPLLYLVHVISVRPENGSGLLCTSGMYDSSWHTVGTQYILIELKYVLGPRGVSRRNQSC